MTAALTSFDRTTCKAVKALALQAMNDKLANLGITASFGNGKFDDLQFDTKIKFSIKETEEGKSAKEITWNRNAILYGLEPKHLGHIVQFHNNSFKIDGWNESGRKNKIALKRLSDNKKFVCSVEAVKHKLP